MENTMSLKKNLSLQCADLTRQLKHLLCCRMAEAKVAAVKMILLHNIQPTGDDDAQASANQGQRYTSVSQSQKGFCNMHGLQLIKSTE
jgi:cell fate regulator YaaT (PSP1 superfamily)